ncbi:MAG: penicillin acylase family protein, partial [Deltaproteobacteria bacterium]|nr:penicillin acylase family protein [Deltaproteobacteria bacterium]
MSLLSELTSRLALAAAGAATVVLVSSGAFAAATTAREPAWGLPHIYGDTDLELARENGREIAKDRMGQLILLARAGRGSLAQAFGLLDSSFVETDKETRLSGYTSSELNRMFDRLSPASRAFILEYCKGVNDTLDDIYAGSIATPIEVSVLRNGLFALSADLFGNATNVSDQVDPYYKAPGGADPEHPHSGFQFTPEMAISIAVVQVRNFGLNTFEEEKRLAELLALQDVNGGGNGQEIWRDLNFLSDPLAPVSVPDPTTPGYGGPLADNQAPTDAIVAADTAKNWPDYDWSGSAASIKDRAGRREELLKRWSAWPKLGSYGWVIASNRSATGHPWLGGFPQTGIQTPSLMHYVENRSGEGISGNGMEFVGGPYVLIGHSDKVAYTTTTAQLRIIDTFFETIIGEDADAARYSDEGTPAPLMMRDEIIKTFSGDIPATFWRTHERGGNGGTRPILDFVGSAEGTAESGSTTTVVDDQAAFDGSYVGGYVLITDGTGAGQIRQISGVPSASTLSVGSAFTAAPASGSVYVAVVNGDDIIGVSNDSGAWLEESTTAAAFSLFQKAQNAMDIRAAVRLIPSTHNFFASDNQAFNGTGTDSGYGNIAYFSSGYSRKRQGGEDKLLPLDGTAANPLIVAEGVVTAATATTVTATGAFGGDYTPDEINYRYLHPADQGNEWIISIMSGTGGKQTRRIASNDVNTVTVEAPWGVTPAPGDAFEVYEIVGMPEAVNPTEGYVANWNNKAATADDGDNFGREHRVAFILERLATDSSWTR